MVAQISKEKGFDQSKALEHAADRLRLYFAYQEEHQNNPESQDLKDFLTLQGAVRVWLRDTFEPATSPSKIPGALVLDTLKKVQAQGRPFGPRLHGICQVIVRPKAATPVEDARQVPGFEKVARSLILDMDQQLRNAAPELLNSERCELFDTLTELIAAKRPPDIQFKRESLLLDLSLDRWDQDFVHQVAPTQTPTLLAPFMTRFGLHLVYVSKIFPAHLPADKNGEVSAKNQKQREKEMRERMVVRWRSDQMKELLQELRKSELIEWEQARP